VLLVVVAATAAAPLVAAAAAAAAAVGTASGAGGGDVLVEGVLMVMENISCGASCEGYTLQMSFFLSCHLPLPTRDFHFSPS